jgi:sugar porter (SP) family MFS transporter
MFPSLIQFFSLFFMPETPAWLFKHHFSERAKQVLQKLRKDKEWMKSVAEMKSSADPHRRGEWKALLHSKLFKVVMLGVVLSAFQQITGINTVIYYAPKIFQSAGFTSATAAIFATLGIGIINVIATLISVKLLDQAGRRRLLLIGIAGMALSLAFLALAFFSSWEKIDQIAVISLMAYVASFAIGLGPVTWVLISEIYPLKVRGKAMTIATFVNWVFNYLVSLTFLDLIASLGSSGTFALYAAISAIGFWFVLQFIPETKDKSLEEIEAEFT